MFGILPVHLYTLSALITRPVSVVLAREKKNGAKPTYFLRAKKIFLWLARTSRGALRAPLTNTFLGCAVPCNNPPITHRHLTSRHNAPCNARRRDRLGIAQSAEGDGYGEWSGKLGLPKWSDEVNQRAENRRCLIFFLCVFVCF